MNGVAGSTIEGHLKEFQWRERHKGTVFTSLLEQIADREIHPNILNRIVLLSIKGEVRVKAQGECK